MYEKVIPSVPNAPGSWGAGLCGLEGNRWEKAEKHARSTCPVLLYLAELLFLEFLKKSGPPLPDAHQRVFRKKPLFSFPLFFQEDRACSLWSRS